MFPSHDQAKIEKRGALGAEQLRELYTARLSMIGNTLFKNGQYTFIWPTLVSSDDKYATLLGLGGYFMIVSVDHSITTKGYDVTVKALQQGLRFDKTGAVVAEVYNVQPTDPAPDLAPHFEPKAEPIGTVEEQLKSEDVVISGRVSDLSTIEIRRGADLDKSFGGTGISHGTSVSSTGLRRNQ